MLLFLFNVGGYYLVFWGLRYQGDKKTWSRLEAAQYSEAETILFKIPMALPYPVNEGVYEQMKGEFEHNGNFYKGIKQKFERDTLFVLCVKDQKEKNLANTMTSYEKASNDLPSKSKHGQGLLSKLLNEYEPFHQIEVIHQNGWLLTSPNSTSTSLDLLAFELSVQSPPPKFPS